MEHVEVTDYRIIKISARRYSVVVDQPVQHYLLVSGSGMDITDMIYSYGISRFTGTLLQCVKWIYAWIKESSRIKE